MDRAFSPRITGGAFSYGVAIGWYGIGPLARKIQRVYHMQCAKPFSARIRMSEIAGAGAESLIPERKIEPQMDTD